MAGGLFMIRTGHRSSQAERVGSNLITKLPPRSGSPDSSPGHMFCRAQLREWARALGLHLRKRGEAC